MKRILLIVSHLGSGSDSLCYSLAQSKLIQWVQDGLIFDDPKEIESILGTKHKYSDVAGMYINEVLYNYQISHKAIYKVCDFLYLIRDPKSSIKITKPKDAEYALNYYIFRLRRIYEMARELKSGIFLTWDDLLSKKGMPFITKKLNLSDDLQFLEVKSDKKLFDLPKPLLKEAERAYELCLYRIRNIEQVAKC